MINPNAQAFPDEDSSGLTKREYFAAMAMHDCIVKEGPGYPFSEKELARRAVEYADALIAELNK